MTSRGHSASTLGRRPDRKALPRATLTIVRPRSGVAMLAVETPSQVRRGP